jgi:predicted lipoprotein with Yx(FWY)xxD motif
MKKFKTSSLLYIVVATCLISVSCSKSSSNDNNPTTPKPNIQLMNNATFGNILADSLGRTLYFFSLDVSGASACTGGCLAAWPVFLKENPTLSAGLNASDFAVITRSDGSKQTTYKGWPLYYFAQDANAGDVNGDNVSNVWFVAKPDYSVMVAKAQLVGLDGVQYKSNYTPGAESTFFVVDSVGKTLYAFSPDKLNTNTWTKADFSNNAAWPIAEIGGVNQVPSFLSKADFGSIQVFGKTQLTFKGWPLYYFGGDASTRGNTKGVSVPTPGIWPIVNNNTTTAPPQ